MQLLFTSGRIHALERRSVTFFIGLLWLIASSAGHAGQEAVHALTGRVLTADNQPASGAAVTLLLFDGGNWRSRYARTDAEGAFRFEQVPDPADKRNVLQMLAQKPGNGLGWTTAEGNADHIEIHLNRPLQLAVRVADTDGKSIAGLKLRIQMLLWSGRPGPLAEVPELEDNRLSATTDQDGRCVFAGLPMGAQVMLAHPDARYAQFGFGSWIIPGEGAQADAGTLTLDAAVAISGTVRYAGPEARPAANVQVHAQPRGQGGAGNADTRTDDQGHFTFRQMAAASYDLRCYLNQETQTQWASPPRQCTVAAGQTVVDEDLTLTHGALITGKITAADTGKGVAGIPVGTEPRPETSAGGNVFGESGPDGNYSLRVVPGKQHVYIATEDLKGYTLPDKHAVDVEIKESETLNLDFALPPTAGTDFVSGRVVDGHGQPVAGAEIFVCMPGEWLFVPPQKADAQGNFRLRVPEIRQWEGRSKPPGPVGVRLFGRTETGLVTAQGLDAKGGAQDIVLKLADHALAQVGGQVSDAQGHAVENVPVRAYVSLGDLPGCNRVVRTDAQGRFAFDGLWPGLEYSFRTEGQGYTSEGVGNVTLTPGENRRLPGWQLASARLAIAGKVVDASGKPVAGATLYPQARRVQNRGGTSDANGEFRLDGLAEEWMWLSVNFNTPTATMVRVKAGDEQVLVELPKPREGGSRDEDNNRSEHFEAMIGQAAPAVQAATWINGPALPAEQWRGKVVMVDFWAVTCGPCIRALPEEQKFWEANQARDLVMIGLHNTGPALEVQEFLQRRGLKITFPLAMDGKHGATASAYGVEVLPTYTVIDRDGNIAYLGHEWEQAQRQATGLLEKRPPP